MWDCGSVENKNGDQEVVTADGTDFHRLFWKLRTGNFSHKERKEHKENTIGFVQFRLV